MNVFAFVYVSSFLELASFICSVTEKVDFTISDLISFNFLNNQRKHYIVFKFDSV